eukprot:12901907-Prorocentrum_lima.AAC.1
MWECNAFAAAAPLSLNCFNVSTTTLHSFKYDSKLASSVQCMMLFKRNWKAVLARSIFTSCTMDPLRAPPLAPCAATAGS